jgi:hypothetical protein
VLKRTEEQKERPVNHLHADGQAAPLTATDAARHVIADAAVCALEQPDCGDDLVGALQLLRHRHAAVQAQQRGGHDRLAHRERVQTHRRLRHEAGGALE